MDPIVGLVAILAVDLMLLPQALSPLAAVSLVRRARSICSAPDNALSASSARAASCWRSPESFNEMAERLEGERREASGCVLAAQEAERLRVARELHDEIGQTLAAVALRAQPAPAGQGGPERRELADLSEVVQESLRDVRRISRELRPEQILDELGLVNALVALCACVTEQSGLRIHRRLEGGPPELALEVELAIYRVAQEALTNAMRHSKATEAKASFSRESLTGMRERAMLIGAALTINSVPGAGVEATMRLGCLDGKT